ncbi:MAG: ATP-binding protein, partial [Cytophagaceae bacterium]
YGVFGGTPRYHALVDTARPAKEEIVDLLFRQRGALEGEVSFLLGSEQIRDPAPYNTVLGAIAQGKTQFGDIQNQAGTERGQLSYLLRVLLDLGWIRREFPFEETSERRALYQVADPFLAFWYRFVQPLARSLPFTDPFALYERQVEPFLPLYMGQHVFESICHQWLQRYAQSELNLTITDAGRWWSRDGQIEFDIVAKLDSGTYLFGECKWSGTGTIGTGVYTKLVAKVERLPEARHRNAPAYVLFSVGGFTGELIALAAEPENRLYLVSSREILPQKNYVQ